MSVQFSTSTYKEEFRSPARGKPTRPRPSSAHRRNNPHPRPDFLLPRRLQTGCGARQIALPQTPLDYGTRFFPPLRHLSLPRQEGKPASLFLWPGSVDRPATHKPGLSLAQSEMEAQKKSCLQSNVHLKGTQCFRSNIQPHITQGDRGILGSEVLKEPMSKQPDTSTLSRYPKPQMYIRKSSSTLDPRGGLHFCKRSSSLGIIRGFQEAKEKAAGRSLKKDDLLCPPPPRAPNNLTLYQQAKNKQN
ncbi:hypothetical protein SKAU_G00302770 [Synaphobranchus kaupii]|uniref:Uncharacterized protein n=1 Tax=Synaphobranchus kaupii TaxID=118154 RepID=A0A9Q1EW28_SYNKA|nr:hypothetical protein SKAU_G00302770 [Synaphobranchus kaupii]